MRCDDCLASSKRSAPPVRWSIPRESDFRCGPIADRIGPSANSCAVTFIGEAQTETPRRVPRYSPSTCVISALSRRLLGGCKLSNKARQWFSITQVLFRQGGGTQPTAPGAGPPQERQPPGALIVTVCPNFIVLAFSRAIWLSSPAIRRSRHILSHALRA